MQAERVYRAWSIQLLLVSGPVATVLSILAAHAANTIIHFDAYRNGPPSISRAIVDPVIGVPFAYAMIVDALLIGGGAAMAIASYAWLVSRLLMPRRWHFVVGAIALAEAFAVAGMVVLSQFRTSPWQEWHDVGSYMLFFGHCVGIGLSGILARRVVVQMAGASQPEDRELVASVKWAPPHSWWVVIVGIVFGALYFGGHMLGDTLLFWRRLLTASIEVLLISYFVWYLWRYTKFVLLVSRAKAGPGSA
ncbi:hypothetical protein [Aestuariivirga litoralis]|uniref:hypothetical protein n=1 Tax=Aestuariivirga litoralis TaxID=2650924 RepID=UPI0018C6715E|nr:hypothetical protein [Aestuariivirga litoralis]MBG1230782.1 hypothetical protein [Aestuariivirga litoralis]